MNNSYKIKFQDGTSTRISAPDQGRAVGKLPPKSIPMVESVSLIETDSITVYHDKGESTFDVHPSLTVGDLLGMLPGTYRIEVSRK